MDDGRDRACCFAGVDVGASTAKAVVIDDAGAILGADVRPSGMDFTASGVGALDAALAEAGLRGDDVARLIATGYGRDNIPPAHGQRTEIACHGKGAYFHHPHAMVVVDVGGQDNKVIRLAETGKRLSFKMNRKCAAGTGAFLEEIAARLSVGLDELNRLALDAARDAGPAEPLLPPGDGPRVGAPVAPLNSFCTVFASTEVLARIRAGEDRGRLARSIFASVAARVFETALLDGDVMVTGGVAAHNPAFVDILQQRLGRPLLVPPRPQLVGALGAALVAREEHAAALQTPTPSSPERD